MHRAAFLSFLCLALTAPFLFLGAGCGGAPELPELAYVGRASCAECHELQMDAHRGSHHDLAMQELGDASVLGDFSGAVLEHYGVRYEFRRDGERYIVRAEDGAGEMRDFEVAYAFGVTPLQQYLVRFEGGALQTLPVCWDSRPKAQGGQRWFHIYPDEAIRPDDPLHWSSPIANWNHMCADCHSTDLRKAYDAETGRYATVWEEIDVSCESCHGPGSQHLAWAEADARGEEWKLANYGIKNPLPGRAIWVREPGEKHAARRPAAPDRREIQTCAPCHSRRTQLVDEVVPGERLLESHRPALIEEGLYFADGQILDEVYVWGSFLQSKMHTKGVTCSDCHDAHSMKLVAPGDALCVRCHDPEHFATKAHHLHEPGSDGSACVDCHMPERSYMVVDPRRDHSMRVPRPDLTIAIGVPNACSACHEEEGPAWAEQKLAEHYGNDRIQPTPHYGTVLAAAWENAPSQVRGLIRLAGDEEAAVMVRATALSLLGSTGSREIVGPLQAALASKRPLLRYGALQALGALPEEVRIGLALPLLEDPLRSLRAEAARLVTPGADRIPESLRSAYRAALAEYESGQLRNADQVWANVNLGVVRRQQGRLDAARKLFEQATELGAWMAPAWTYLAEIHRLQNDEAAAERTLRKGLETTTEPALLRHQLGLTLRRRGRPEQALAELRKAYELDVTNGRHAYVYAVALWEAKQRERALEILRATQARSPSREVEQAIRSYEAELK